MHRQAGEQCLHAECADGARSCAVGKCGRLRPPVAALGSLWGGSCVHTPGRIQFPSTAMRPCPLVCAVYSCCSCRSRRRASQSLTSGLPPSLGPQHCTLGGVVLTASGPRLLVPERWLPACLPAEAAGVGLRSPNILFDPKPPLDPRTRLNPNPRSTSDPSKAPVPAHPPQSGDPPPAPKECGASTAPGPQTACHPRGEAASLQQWGWAAPFVRGSEGSRLVPHQEAQMTPTAQLFSPASCGL